MSTGIDPTSFYGKPKKVPATPKRLVSRPPPTVDTPTHDHWTSTNHYTSNISQQPVKDAFVEASSQVSGKFTLIPPESFFDAYLPVTNDLPKMPQITKARKARFKAVAEQKLEPDMYEPMIQALCPFIKRTWSLVNTSKTPDPNSAFLSGQNIQPDATLYSDREKSDPKNENLCRAVDAEVFVEFKATAHHDPFDDRDNKSLEKESMHAMETRGQVVTYLNAQQAAQFRTHGFLVLIVKDQCRLMRLTRSGIVSTTSFSYCETGHMQTFFWRITHAPPAVRGIDTTFERVHSPPSEVIDRLKVGDIVYTGPVWKVTVEGRDFYVGKPFTRTHIHPIGRGTRCFVAVEDDTYLRCVLKDVWRIPEYKPEGEVYQKLHAAKVRNIPPILAAGDVVDAAGKVQTCGPFPEATSPKPKMRSSGTMRAHRHYRIVLGVVGASLTDFDSTHELATAILHALQAHQDAYNNAGIEHRDISSGNIIIVRDGKGGVWGNLIDWEFSKYREEDTPRAQERTGTRQFMAARLCKPNPPARELGDEIESFMLVFLWVAGRYAPGKADPNDLEQFLQNFDNLYGLSKINLLMAKGNIRELRLSSMFLRKLLNTLITPFPSRYEQAEESDELSDEVKVQQKQLADHKWMTSVIEEAVAEEAWKKVTDDPAVRDKLPPPANTRHHKKRQSHHSHYETETKRLKMQSGPYQSQYDYQSITLDEREASKKEGDESHEEEESRGKEATREKDESDLEGDKSQEEAVEEESDTDDEHGDCED